MRLSRYVIVIPDSPYRKPWGFDDINLNCACGAGYCGIIARAIRQKKARERAIALGHPTPAPEVRQRLAGGAARHERNHRTTP